jgi:hypothetical protein
MATRRIDQFARSLADGFSRRVLVGFPVLALGLTAIANERAARAKKRHKRKKKIRRNNFGCVNVGRFCKNEAQCCSGICSGKKGKKKCRAHDTGGCTAEQDTCVDPAGSTCTTSTGYAGGKCTRTTGNASFCTNVLFACIECTKDSDCQQYCGPSAACVVCPDQCAGFSTTICTGTGTGCHG